MPDHPYGWLSLMPPVVAIALAIATRRVVLSLLAGIFVGAMILRGGNPFWGLSDTLEIHLWETLTDPTNLRIFTFTLLMGAMVAVISGMGGMRGLINLVTPWAKDRRRGQLVTWFSGLLIFFDDYANTIVLGNTLRSLSDKLRISREKLSFLVDSTAAPVAGIAPLSTWVAWEIMQISEGLKNAGVSDDVAGGLSSKLFLMSIPYRFYAIWMLVFVPMVAIMLRDFGPMRKAERDMRSRGRSSGMIEVAENVATNDENKITDGKWFNAALPIGLTLTMVIVLIFTTGYNKWKTGDENLIAVRAEIQPKIIDILGEADSPMALAYGALGGLALAAALALGQRLLSWKQIQEASVEGMKTILPAIAILVSAMALSGLTKGDTPKPGENAYPDKARMLYTGVYLGDLLLGEEEAEVSGNSGMSENSATPSKVKTVDLSGEEKNASTISARRKFLTRMLPTIVFVLSGIIAFCTGTSFGTMGILMPMTVSIAYTVLGGIEAVGTGNPILLGTIGGVLAGSIFGDHCSPISDTTVLSSQASGCNHLSHVWTQMPYALLVGSISILCGTLPLGFGVPVWVLLPLGIVAMALVLLFVGEKDTMEDIA